MFLWVADQEELLSVNLFKAGEVAHPILDATGDFANDRGKLGFICPAAFACGRMGGSPSNGF